MNQRLAEARSEAMAVSGWLLVAIGTLKRAQERADGREKLRAEMIADNIAEARAALNRFEDVCRIEEAAP